MRFHLQDPTYNRQAPAAVEYFTERDKIYQFILDKHSTVPYIARSSFEAIIDDYFREDFKKDVIKIIEDADGKNENWYSEKNLKKHL